MRTAIELLGVTEDDQADPAQLHMSASRLEEIVRLARAEVLDGAGAQVVTAVIERRAPGLDVALVEIRAVLVVLAESEDPVECVAEGYLESAAASIEHAANLLS